MAGLSVWSKLKSVLGQDQEPIHEWNHELFARASDRRLAARAGPDISDPVRLGPRPGSDGEHELQELYGTTSRANVFYDKQVLDYLNGPMQTFIGHRQMCFLGTSDSKGECDTSFRAGEAGFVVVLDERRVAFPQYRGNGVMASLGNILENGHASLLFIDFGQGIGLHVNGKAQIVDDAEMRDRPELPVRAQTTGPKITSWLQVDVEEAYIHCSRHIPLMEAVARGNGTPRPKGRDFFAARTSPRYSRPGKTAEAGQPCPTAHKIGSESPRTRPT